MKLSKQALRESKAWFRACLVNGSLDESRVRLAVRQLIAKKSHGHLAVLTHLARLVKMEQERRKAKVESAVPLSAELQAAVRDKLNRLYGSQLNLSFGQNPALLGGLRIQVGSDVYDGSVQGRLQRLQESF